MHGLLEGNTPSYISSQSADVILSDVRPFKLKTEALHAINALLDEFLYNILNTAGSLLTDRLRAGLLGLLPTSLGKEALLEAEVELRAYWDRTNGEGAQVSPLEDDSRTFYLQWSFELLRLKCEAYSTLNESDEDPSVEDRIHERFIQSVAVPPSAALLAPAALYLTAILEAMCEHILTNVGRVAARDSSRVNATVNDLFTALCEDDSIYGLFRTMRVYEQIEALSKSPVKSRRSKSFSRSELSTTLSSRTGSPHQDLLSGKESISVPHSRLSSEVSSSTSPNMPGITTTTSRPSLEKARSMKLFKNSLDSESQGGYSQHKKSESFISEKTLDDSQRSITEESALQQEFDDLMRSSSTMKVSLTPDRLKTMEVYKQEKDMRPSRRPVPLSFKSDTDSISSKRPSLRHVDSIIEDEEELAFPQPPANNFSRLRQGSAATPPSAPLTATASTVRTRAISTSGVVRKPPPPIPSSFSQTPRSMTRPNKLVEPNGFPPRTRKRQVNRESLDLDDVMGGYDDEDIPLPPTTPSTVSTMSPKAGKVSASTRELMDFLAQGPPDEPFRPGGDLGDFLNNGPPRHNPSSASLDAKPKGDRLRRMISKLSIGNGEKSKNGIASSTPSRTPATRQPPLPAAVLPTPPRPPRMPSQRSHNGLASLANRPIPPRPPRPPSPPSSDEEISPPPSPVKMTAPEIPSSPAPSSTRSSNRPPSPVLIPPRRDSRDRTSRQSTVNGSSHTSLNGSVNGSTNGRVNGQIKHPVDAITSNPAANEPQPSHTINEVRNSTPPPAENQKVQTSIVATFSPTPSHSDLNVGLSPTAVGQLHRLMSTATSADECRLILDMMITNHKVLLEHPATEESCPIPSTLEASSGKHASPDEVALERTLVAFFLGEDTPLEDVPRASANEVPASMSASHTDIKPSTPIMATPSSNDNNNNTLVGELKA
ncbi:hypothetical protein P691DRAFT_757736 [Macrolepiota fuliginosa MF-IS2]|uniref:Uncharacterized protein n=1 Tax=Macrolepiota fuliginosa MF-IS2 TaxID=1400762 RepID=A0A9P5XHB5_9AGAR|nr:hypothetical protein P691DRAFT_757736 [Macrolepiota fuliginosa MF-IS2]